MVIGDICCEQPFQMGFVERDHVIKQIVPATLDPSFCHAVLPRTLNRGTDRFHLQRADRRSNFDAELGITIKDQESWTSYKGKRFSQLLNNPSARGMPRDIEMQNPLTVMADDEETVEQAESYRRDCEKVHRCDSFAMVSQKREPSFSLFWISRRAPNPAGNGSLENIEAQHQELPVNSGCAPGWILRNHPKNQIADFFGDSLPSNHTSCPRDRTPIQSESSAVPTNHSFRAYYDESLLPARPKPARKNPEELIEHPKAWPRVLPFKYGELLSKNQVFKQERPASTKTSKNGCQKEANCAKHYVVLPQCRCGFQ